MSNKSTNPCGLPKDDLTLQLTNNQLIVCDSLRDIVMLTMFTNLGQFP